MIHLKQIVAGCNRFFFEPESPLPIAVYRILLGIIVLTNYALLLPNVQDWFGNRGTISQDTARRLAGGAGFSLFTWLPDSDASVWIVFLLSCLAASATVLGVFTRASSILLFLTFITLHHRNPLVLNSGDTFLRTAVFFMMFAPAGAALSIDRLVRIARGKETGPPVPQTPWAMRLIQLQLSFLYIYTFAWKAIGTTWPSGTAIYYTSRLTEYWRFPIPYVFEHMWTIKLWTWSTLLVELSLGTLVWIKKLRYWVLLAGLLLHVGIEYSMNIPLFSFIMISAYVTFVEPHTLEGAFSLLRTKWNSVTGFTTPLSVLYDGKCSFCTRSIEILRCMDVLHRLTFYDMHATDIVRQFPDFDAERGEKELLVHVRNEWFGGFFAIRYIARHLPLAWPGLPLLYLPPVSAAGNRIYRHIAARRSCSLQPL